MSSKDREWVNVAVDGKTRRALERYRRILEEERGTPVTKSDAVRSAVLRIVESHDAKAAP